MLAGGWRGVVVFPVSQAQPISPVSAADRSRVWQLTLNCVFVVNKGKFVGMINKADMMKGDF